MINIGPVTFIAGVGIARCAAPDEISLTELVFAAASAALADAGCSRADLDGVCLAASDQLDGRAISSMQLAGPAGGYLLDEVKVSDDGALALAAAALRLECGASRRVLAVSWTKSSESPPDAAVGVNPEPVLSRPAGLHPWAGEAAVSASFLHRHGLDRGAFDEVAARLRGNRRVEEGELCWPVRRGHVPPPSDAAVALVVAAEPPGVRLAGLAWATDPPQPTARRRRPEEAVALVAQRAAAEAGVELRPDLAVETTDRTPFRLAITAVGLGLTTPEDVADALATGRLPELNPSGGLWAINPIFAAGLERVAEAVRRIREGVPEALAHSSYGYAGQGQFVAVLRQAA